MFKLSILEPGARYFATGRDSSSNSISFFTFHPSAVAGPGNEVRNRRALPAYLPLHKEQITQSVISVHHLLHSGWKKSQHSSWVNQDFGVGRWSPNAWYAHCGCSDTRWGRGQKARGGSAKVGFDIQTYTSQIFPCMLHEAQTDPTTDMKE